MALLKTLWTETADLLRRVAFGRPGSPRVVLLMLVVLLAFGVFIPWWKGLDFLDPMILAAYSAVALLFAAPVAAELLANPNEIDSLRILYAKVGAAVLYGWAVSVIILAAGLATVNFVARGGVLLHPRWDVLCGILLLGLLAALFVAAVSAVLTILFSAAAAKTVLRLSFLLLLAVLLAGWGRMPQPWRDAVEQQMTSQGILRLCLTGSAVLLVLDAALLIVLRAPFVDRR